MTGCQVGGDITWPCQGAEFYSDLTGPFFWYIMIDENDVATDCGPGFETGCQIGGQLQVVARP